MKKKILFTLILPFLITNLTGCGSNKEIEKGNKKNAGKKANETEVKEKYLSISRIHNISSFEDGYIEIDIAGEYLSSIPYLLNDKFEALYTWDYPGNRVGGYVKTRIADDKGMIYIYDTNGDIAFSYKEKEYKYVELVTNGYLIIKKQNDTYNSSETTIGVYSLKDKKYIIEPSTEYTNCYPVGDDMYQLDNDKKVFFNSKTAKIIKFDEAVLEDFQDGYAVDIKNGQIVVFKNDGTKKIIPYNYDNSSYYAKDAVKNGYLVDIYSGIDNNKFRIINLETSEVLDLSGKFYRVDNKPKFTKDGYALVVFTNQGGILYYTIINKKGEMNFEPVKISTDNQFLSNYDKELSVIGSNNIEGEKYIILGNNGEINSQVRDLKNNLIFEGDEDETFLRIENDKVVVRHPTNAGDEYYFKDLKGNKIKIIDKTTK